MVVKRRQEGVEDVVARWSHGHPTVFQLVQTGCADGRSAVSAERMHAVSAERMHGGITLICCGGVGCARVMLVVAVVGCGRGMFAVGVGCWLWGCRWLMRPETCPRRRWI